MKPFRKKCNIKKASKQVGKSSSRPGLLTPDTSLNSEARLAAPGAGAATPSREANTGRAFSSGRRRVRGGTAAAADGRGAGAVVTTTGCRAVALAEGRRERRGGPLVQGGVRGRRSNRGPSADRGNRGSLAGLAARSASGARRRAAGGRRAGAAGLLSGGVKDSLVAGRVRLRASIAVCSGALVRAGGLGARRTFGGGLGASSVWMGRGRTAVLIGQGRVATEARGATAWRAREAGPRAAGLVGEVSGFGEGTLAVEGTALASN